MIRPKHLVNSALIAAVITALGHFLLPGGWRVIFASLGETAAGSLAWASTAITVPAWLIAFLVAVVLVTAGAAMLFARTRREEPAAEVPLPTTADVFGVRWRWSYHEGSMHDLRAFCPKCNQPVHPIEEKRHGFLQLISFQCECRKWRSRSFQCSTDALLDRVCHAVQQDLRKRPVRTGTQRAATR